MDIQFLIEEAKKEHLENFKRIEQDNKCLLELIDFVEESIK